MNIFEKNYKNISFNWLFIGPIFLILSLNLFLFKPSFFHAYYSLICAIGIYMCCKWNWKGFVGSILLVLILMMYVMKEVPSQNQLWELLFCSSILLGFSITYLGRELFQQEYLAVLLDTQQVNQVQKELENVPKRELETVLEELQKAKDEHHLELNQAQQKLVASEQARIIAKEEQRLELNQAQQKLVASEQALIIAKEEHRLELNQAQQKLVASEQALIIAKEEHRLELNQAQQHLLITQESLQKAEEEHRLEIKYALEDLSAVQQALKQIKDASQSEFEKTQRELEETQQVLLKKQDANELELNQVQQKLVASEQTLISEKEKHYLELSHVQNELIALQQNLNNCLEQIMSDKQQMALLTANVKDNERILKDKDNEILKLKEDFANRIEAISLNSKTKERQEMRKAQGLYLQLREQFEQKSQILSQTRHELFLVQEELFVLKKEKLETEMYDYSQNEKALIDHILQMEQVYL